MVIWASWNVSETVAEVEMQATEQRSLISHMVLAQALALRTVRIYVAFKLGVLPVAHFCLSDLDAPFFPQHAPIICGSIHAHFCFIILYPSIPRLAQRGSIFMLRCILGSFLS